jgi:hypothetical protein
MSLREESAPLPAELAPGRLRIPSALAWLRRSGPVIPVAAGVLWLSLKGGGYALTVRSPAAIAIWAAVALGVALKLWPRAEPPRAALVTGALLAAFAALTGLSAVWADSAEKAFIEFDRVVLYLGLFALVVLAAGRGSARRWSDGLALGIAAVGVLSLSSRLFPDLFGPSAVSELDPSDPRLSYPVNYWNGLAELVAVGIPLLLAVAVRSRTSFRGAAAVAVLPALAAVIYLTSSRGGMAAAALGVGLFVVLTTRRTQALAALGTAAAGSAAAIAVLLPRDELVNGPVGSAAIADQGRGAALLIVLICALTALAYGRLSRVVPSEIHVPTWAKRVAAALALVAVVAAGVAADPSSRFESLQQPPRDFGASYTGSHILSSGGSGRWQFWEAAVDQFKDSPLLGGGAGSYEAWWAQHGTLSYFTRNAHSLFLETLGELGAVGFLLLLAVAAFGLATAIGRLRAGQDDERVVVAALIGAFVAFLLAAAIDWVWDLTVVGAVGVVCLALLTGAATVARVESPVSSPDGGRRGRWSAVGWRAGLVVVALGLVLAQTIPLATELKIRASQKALKRGDAVAALSEARNARTYQGWAASPHLQVALVQESRGRLRSAREEIRTAIERDRSDWRLWAVASRIQEESGSIAEARRSYDTAKALNPRSPLFKPKRSRTTESAP